MIFRGVLGLSLFFAAVALAQGNEHQRVLSDLKGLDFSKLPTPAAKELATVFTDEFDYCGRPMTIAATLKKGDGCRHTKRMAALAASQAMEGSSASEIIASLARYNQSFTAKRHTFKIDERTCKGPKDAKVTLVEFSDFECPYCALARPMLEELVAKKKDVRVCWAAFPLQAHPNAIPAATAALFARDHGKFWAVHDALFENQLSLSDGTIREILKKNGLDVAAYAKALAGNKYADELSASRDAGKAANVDSTPSVYVNGRKLTLLISVEALSATVEDELDWLEGKNSWL